MELIGGGPWLTGYSRETSEILTEGSSKKETGNSETNDCRTGRVDSPVFWSALFLKNLCWSVQHPFTFLADFSMPHLPQVLEVFFVRLQSASLPIQYCICMAAPVEVLMYKMAIMAAKAFFIHYKAITNFYFSVIKFCREVTI